MTTPKKIVVAGTVVALAAVAVVLFSHRHQIAHRFAIAKGRRLVANHIAKISDLTKRVTFRSELLDNVIAFPQWSVVPRKFETFRNVPLQIDGMLCLWGADNAKEGLILPKEQLGIGVAPRFQTLYIYHATFYSSPPKTPVYEVVFRYADGSSATNQILYCDDVFDWFSGVHVPTNPRSKVAWRGSYNRGGKAQQLSFYLTAIENPQPTIPVISLDLYSCKSDSAACIGAITAGPAGLMQ